MARSDCPWLPKTNGVTKTKQNKTKQNKTVCRSYGIYHKSLHDCRDFVDHIMCGVCVCAFGHVMYIYALRDRLHGLTVPLGWASVWVCCRGWDHFLNKRSHCFRGVSSGPFKHYAKLSRAMRAPWVDRFLNNEIYCYPLSTKQTLITIPSGQAIRGDRNLRPAAT